MYFLLNMGIFHCYVSLPEENIKHFENSKMEVDGSDDFPIQRGSFSGSMLVYSWVY